MSHDPLSAAFTALTLPFDRVNSLRQSLQTPLKSGDVWFLLDVHWFQSLSLYIESLKEEEADEVLSPGPIENGHLFEPDSLSTATPVLRDRLIEELEYVKLPALAWHTLRQRFGIVSESHVVQRKVICHTGPSSSYTIVEVYLMVLRLCPYGKEDTGVVTKSFSRVTKCSALVADMRKIFDVADETEVRLHCNHSPIDVQSDLILADAGLYSGATVQLEVRNADGSWSSDQRAAGQQPKTTAGVCGLINLGHTCFMNTAIQCLSNVPQLTKYLMSEAYTADINVMNPLGTGGELVAAFADLVMQLWSGDRPAVAPRNFKRLIGSVSDRFSGYEEEDTQELMAFLLDALHEDVNRVTDKPYIPNPDTGDGRPDDVVANECWSNYKKRNDSFIVALFHGMLASNVTCTSCQFSSTRFDPFCFLSIPMPSQETRPVTVTMHGVEVANLLIPTRGSVSEIRDRLMQVLSENDITANSDKVVLAEIYESRFLRIFKNCDSYGKNLTKVYAHEIQDDTSLVSVYMRSNGILFGDPFMISAEKLDYNCLHQEIQIILKTRFKQVTCLSLSLANAYGNVVFHVLSPDQHVPRMSRTYIVVDVDHQTAQPNNYKAIQIKTITCQTEKSEVIRITDCISEFLSPEIISADDGWFCSSCNAHRDAIKKLSIWSLPKVLIVHVKRFGFNPLGNDKLDTAFDYPVHGLDLSEFIAKDPASQKESVYDLVSVALHYGGLRSGHYTAFGKNAPTGDWHHFKDAKVTQVSESEVVSKEAYVLFYVRRE